MKAKKLNEMTTQELIEREKELKTELFNLRFQQATGELTNPMRIKECKKDIARVKTIVNQRGESLAVAK
jgi:large subunit ribosomal protein L29